MIIAPKRLRQLSENDTQALNMSVLIQNMKWICSLKQQPYGVNRLETHPEATQPKHHLKELIIDWFNDKHAESSVRMCQKEGAYLIVPRGWVCFGCSCCLGRVRRCKSEHSIVWPVPNKIRIPAQHKFQLAEKGMNPVDTQKMILCAICIGNALGSKGATSEQESWAMTRLVNIYWIQLNQPWNGRSIFCKPDQIWIGKSNYLVPTLTKWSSPMRSKTCVLICQTKIIHVVWECKSFLLDRSCLKSNEMGNLFVKYKCCAYEVFSGFGVLETQDLEIKQD